MLFDWKIEKTFLTVTRGFHHKDGCTFIAMINVVWLLSPHLFKLKKTKHLFNIRTTRKNILAAHEEQSPHYVTVPENSSRPIMFAKAMIVLINEDVKSSDSGKNKRRQKPFFWQVWNKLRRTLPLLIDNSQCSCHCITTGNISMAVYQKNP